MSENVWEYICDDGVKEAMRLCGCEEKYISGNASDFEKFREWMATLTLFDNNEYMQSCCMKIGVAIGEVLTLERIEEYSASYIWQKYASRNCLHIENQLLEYSAEKDNYSPSFNRNNITVDFFYNTTDILWYETLLSKGREKTKRLENPIYVKFSEGEFKRPDRYSAEMISKRNICGEKCNNTENNLFLCQLVCEIIYAEKNNTPIFIFDLINGSECAAGLLKYLVKRELSARIYLIVEPYISPNKVKEICLLGTRECFVTPLLRDSDSPYIRELEKIYPSGLIDII